MRASCYFTPYGAFAIRFILDEKNQLVSIPNVTFMEEAVVNVTPHAWSELVIPIVIGNDLDLAAFEREVLKSLGKLQLHLDKRFPPVLSTKSKNVQSTDLTLILHIRNPDERDSMLAEVNNRIAEVTESMRKSGRSSVK